MCFVWILLGGWREARPRCMTAEQLAWDLRAGFNPGFHCISPRGSGISPRQIWAQHAALREPWNTPVPQPPAPLRPQLVHVGIHSTPPTPSWSHINATVMTSWHGHPSNKSLFGWKGQDLKAACSQALAPSIWVQDAHLCLLPSVPFSFCQ